jgi:hypothetical protein
MMSRVSDLRELKPPAKTRRRSRRRARRMRLALLRPFVLARPRTLPQHTLPLLPLLRSRPGGVHKASVVRSPGSDKALAIAECRLFDTFLVLDKLQFVVIHRQSLLELCWKLDHPGYGSSLPNTLSFKIIDKL